MKYLLTSFFISALCTISLFSNENNKQDTIKVYRLPSISVTTNKADTENSTVPFTELNQSEIIKAYTMQDLPQILNSMPSIITFSENGSNIGYTNLSLRGFDQRRIAVMLNGVPQNDPEDHNFYWINLSDIASSLDNVQVQRGGGMSIYGPAAIAGSIQLSTVNYTNYRGIALTSGIGFQEYGNEGTAQISSRFGLEYSSGLIEDYAFYAKVGRLNSFGYRAQSFAYLNSYFLSAMKIIGNLTSQINIYGGWQEDGLAYNGLPKSYTTDPEKRQLNYSYFSYDRKDGQTVDWTTTRRKVEVEKFAQPIFELLNDYKINDETSIKSSLFYKYGDGYFDYDGTGWTDKTSFRLNDRNGYPNAEDPSNPIIRANVTNNTFGWIPKIETENTLGNLLIGIEARIHNSSHWGKINFAENLPENYDPDFKFYSYQGARKIFSLFGSQKIKVTDKFTTNVDLQLVYHNYKIHNERDGINFTTYKDIAGNIVGNGNDLFSINYFFVNPRLGLNYILNEANRVYFSVAYTSREPRMKNLYAASDSWMGDSPLFNYNMINNEKLYDFTNPLVKPEKMIDFELGWFLNTEDFNANLNLYYMDYTDELVKSGQLDIFGAPIDGNAPKTSHTGIEAVAQYKLFNKSKIGRLTLDGNLTYSMNKIVDFDFALKTGDKLSLKDNKIAGFPDIISNVGISYMIENFFAALSMRYSGEFYTDNFGTMLQTEQKLKDHFKGEYYYDNVVDSYTVFNANLMYTFLDILSFERIKLHLQINNITNLLYASYGIGKEFFPAAERNFYFGIEIGL